MADFRRFFNLARLVQSYWHRRIGRQTTKGKIEMSNVSYFMRHALAAVAAVLITGTLMVNGLAQSAPEVSSVAGILA